MIMTDSDHKQALPPGYQLGHYRLLEVLGVGGFGVTYLGEHVSLGHRVAVKEYLPNEFAVREGATVHPKSPADREDFEWGLARFVDEARTLTRFRHPNLVRVSDYFEANSTAYIVMDYEDGEPLDKLLDRRGTLTEAQLKRVLLPVADGLRQVHAAGFLHRDVKPSNIFVRRSDETPVLLDFGAARNALGRKSRSMTAVVTPGYSPPEQYETDGEQGPWTDIYALSALCFRAMTGNRPEESIRRSRLLFQDRKDPLPSLEAKGVSGYSSQFLAAVDWGLRVIETERPQSLDGWLAQLGNAPAISAGRRTGSPTPPEAPVRPVARERAGTGAKGALLAGAAVVAVGVALYFALAHWPQIPDRDRAQPKVSDSPAIQLGSAGQSEAENTNSAKATAPDGSRESPLGGGSALLVVETNPPGVEVLAGDHPLGETPLELANLRAGAYDLMLRHPHYETIRLKNQRLVDGEVLRIERTLARGLGKLTVLTTPRDAWVERDGERLASRTPVTLEGLPAGALQLTLGADGHQTAQVRAEVPKDGLGRLERVLQPIVYGTLTLELVPADAAVTLPDIGPSYRPGMRLPEGRYRVIASREGYVQATREVAVPGNGEARERIELERLLEVGARFRDCPECPEMVVVPAGSFLMGSPDAEEGRDEYEGPLHRVTFAAPFAVGVYEVTVAEFGRFVDTTGHSTGNLCYVSTGHNKGELRNGFGWRNPGFGQGGSHPAVCVSWEDAKSYVAWLSQIAGERYRLPSESEWEYAARAGTRTARWWGEGESGQCTHANGADANAGYSWVIGCSDGHSRTAPVGSLRMNAWGLHDVLGNAWEWTEDCWNASYRSAPSDGSAWEHGDCNFRMFRGGSWNEVPRLLRSAFRNGSGPGLLSNDNGFRVARTLTP